MMDSMDLRVQSPKPRTLPYCRFSKKKIAVPVKSPATRDARVLSVQRDWKVSMGGEFFLPVFLLSFKQLKTQQ